MVTKFIMNIVVKGARILDMIYVALSFFLPSVASCMTFFSSIYNNYSLTFLVTSPNLHWNLEAAALTWRVQYSIIILICFFSFPYSFCSRSVLLFWHPPSPPFHSHITPSNFYSSVLTCPNFFPYHHPPSTLIPLFPRTLPLYSLTSLSSPPSLILPNVPPTPLSTSHSLFSFPLPFSEQPESIPS